jgi:nicotinate phosphoribosyltransferase
LENSIATKELLVASVVETPPNGARELLVPLVTGGQLVDGFTGTEGVLAARKVHVNAMSELPLQAHRLQRGEPALATEFI